MLRKIGLIIGFAICIVNLKAQDVKFGLQTGQGYYNMSSLKSINLRVVDELPFEAKIVSNYPPYWYYQPTVKWCFKKLEFGVAYTFQSTGSRISVEDYSGEYKFDTKVNGNSFGIILGTTNTDSSKFYLGCSVQAGANFSVLKMNEYLQIDTVVTSTDYVFKANSFYLEPGISFNWGITKNFLIEANLAYYKEFFRQDFKLSGEQSNIIPVKKGIFDSDIWDGLRLGVTLSYIIFN